MCEEESLSRKSVPNDFLLRAELLCHQHPLPCCEKKRNAKQPCPRRADGTKKLNPPPVRGGKVKYLRGWGCESPRQSGWLDGTKKRKVEMRAMKKTLKSSTKSHDGGTSNGKVRSNRHTSGDSANLAATLPEEQLTALIAGARFAYSKPLHQTQFHKEFAERLERSLRRKLVEEASREHDRSKSSQKLKADKPEISKETNK